MTLKTAFTGLAVATSLTAVPAFAAEPLNEAAGCLTTGFSRTCADTTWAESWASHQTFIDEAHVARTFMDANRDNAPAPTGTARNPGGNNTIVTTTNSSVNIGGIRLGR